MILVFGIMVCSASRLRAEGLEEGAKVQNFTLANGLTGEKVTFDDDIKGKSKVTAIIFANSSCGACRKELATLSKLADENEEFETFVVLVDMKGAEIIESFSKRFDLQNSDQHLLYSFIPRLPYAPDTFSEAQLRWISGCYPEDFAHACRMAAKDF